MNAAQEAVEAQEFTASVGGGVVEAKVNGKKEVLAVTIKPEAVDPEDVEMLQDLVISAVNEALRQADEAMIISRDASNWTNEITIDLGSMAGVKEDMVVVASKGMIGKVTSVTEVSSTVQLLTAEKPVSDLPVQIMNGDQNAYGLLKGYDVESKCYEVTLLSNIDKLEPNANVITSGLGGDQKAPKGIYIGVAEGMDVSSDGTTKTLKVKPAEDFSDLTYVSVVFRGNNNE